MDKLIYNTTLSSCFSPCGGYYLLGNIYGDIVVYDIKCLSNITRNVLTEETIGKKPKFSFRTSNKFPVHSMVSTDNFFIIGTIEEVTGWEWNSVISGNPKISWTVRIPKSKDLLESIEVNCLSVGHIGEGNAGMVLFAGCEDGNIYVFSLEDGKCLRTYQGHTNYLHSISTIDTRLISGDEDGVVRLWDSRSSKVIDIIYPYKNENINRPELGKWIGAVSLNEDWLVCGGGACLSLWNLRMLNPMTVFTNTEDRGIHVVYFIEDKIFAGGTAPFFSQLTYDNELCSKIQTSSNTIYCCSYQRSPIKLLMLAGSSDKIDVCTNLSYRDFIYSL